jgi:glycine cleavage system aminomethyltransferase T
VERQKAEGVCRRLVNLVVSDPAAYASGGELLLRDGEPAGFASSAAFGHTVGRAVLLGYIERHGGGKADRDWLGRGTYQVAIGGERYDASASLQPPYDPSGARIRA